MYTPIQKKITAAFDALKGDFHYANNMQSPKILKVVISSGTGSTRDKERTRLVQDRLAKITGQKAAPRGAKQSIASFKVRKGQVVGFEVTLRGARMYDFLDKLIHVSLPRTRDFRGISPKSIDAMGNITIGIREHTIFPETSDEDLRDIFGLAVTIVTTATNKKEAESFFRFIGLPLQK